MSRDEDLGLTAAECAARTGLTVRALRVYEEYGLIAPGRTLSGWRCYGKRDLIRLNSISLLKSTGLTLAQISTVTRLSDEDPSLRQLL
jgi:DNA-binding transcriptional MerR regulator